MSILKIGIYAIFAWLGISIEAFGILIGLMCIDSIVGIIKSLRLGKKFSFGTLLWGYTLKLCFLIIPLVVSLLGKSLGYDFAIAVNITISILSVAEVYSIIGNIYSAKTRVEIERIDAISLLLKSLRTLLEKILLGLIEKLRALVDIQKS